MADSIAEQLYQQQANENQIDFLMSKMDDDEAIVEVKVESPQVETVAPQLEEDKVEEAPIQLEDKVEEKPKTMSEPVQEPETKKLDFSKIKISNDHYSPNVIADSIKVPSGYYTIAAYSAYSCYMRSLSLSEKQTLLNNSATIYEERLKMFKTVYNCIEDMGIKKPSFENWTKITSFLDYQSLLFGIYCATYPKGTTFKETCVNKECNHEYDSVQKPQEFRIVNEGEIFERFKNVNNNMIDVNFIKENTLIGRMLNDSYLDGKILIEFKQTASLADVLNCLKVNTAETIRNFPNLLGYTTVIHRLFIQKSGTDEYYCLQTPKEITTFLMSDSVNAELEDLFDETLGKAKYKVEFYTKDINCPQCGTESKGNPVDTEMLLNLKIQGQLK